MNWEGTGTLKELHITKISFVGRCFDVKLPLEIFVQGKFFFN